MKLILDNNSLFSIMNPKSVSAYLFSSIKAEFFAPEFIKHELEKYKSECLIKSKISEQEFKVRQIEIEESIKFFKASEYEEFLEKSLELISDPKDSPYLALALSIKASIWSNDPHLKSQPLIKVFTTKELLSEFLKGNL